MAEVVYREAIKHAMTEAQVNAAIKQFVYAHESKTMQAMAALSLQMRNFEDANVMEFLGPHAEGKEYSGGSVVQKNGATYVALADRTKETPGKSGDWRRICSGKD